MNNRKTRLVSLGLLLILAFSCPVFAESGADLRASEQLRSYSMYATAVGNGRIAITFSVDGNRKMTQIGAERIVIYYRVGGSWVVADSLDKDDTGMSTGNAYYYGNTIYYNGVSGTDYQIEITIFAEDSSGYDSRTKICDVTA